jgi:FixJ family two-component response regulator
MQNPNSKVLVLDDERIVLESVSRILEEQGYLVETHQAAKSALEALRTDKFQLLITDLRIPDLDGLQVMKESKRIDPDIPIVVLTAYASVDTAREALKSGAVDYVKKPFTPEQLIDLVQRVLASRVLEEQRDYRNKAFEELKRNISSSLSLREILNQVVEGVVKILRVKGATISLLDKEKKYLRVAAYHGLSNEYVSKGPLGSSASIGAMILEGEPILISDATSDPRAQYPQEASREGVKSILSVPLLAKDHIIGALRLYTSEMADFTEEDIKFAQGFAEYVSLAIENAQKYEDVKGEYNVLMDDLWDHFDIDGWL